MSLAAAFELNQRKIWEKLNRTRVGHDAGGMHGWGAVGRYSTADEDPRGGADDGSCPLCCCDRSVQAHSQRPNPLRWRQVTKFGGSSCGSAEAYRRLGDYFEQQLNEGHRPVGVFSAMFAVTDSLLAALDAAAVRDQPAVAAARARIWDLHERTLHELLAQPGDIEEVS